MATLQALAFRLSVWRPVRWSDEFLDTREGRPADTAAFHESIYSWDLMDNPVDAIQDLDQSGMIEKEIFQQFAPEQPPQNRQIQKLHEKLEILDNILTDHGAAWMDSAHSATSESGAEINLRMNRLLAFRQALQWVCDTFRDVPQASVTLR